MKHTTRNAERASIKRLRAFGRIVNGESWGDLPEQIVRRICRIRRNTQFGAYLLADSQGYLYLLRAEAGVCDAMVTKLHRMLVGLYLNATPEQIIADIEQHMHDLTLSPVVVQCD